MKKYGRDLLETFPVVGVIYRAMRNYYRVKDSNMRKTPYGFFLVGQKEHDDIFNDQFENLEIRLINSLIEHVDIFIDIGANIGLFTMLARRAGKKVIAFEPLDQNLKFLYSNLYKNKFTDVEVYPIALSNEPGVATLYGASMMASMVENWGDAVKSARQIVAISTLDIILGGRLMESSAFVKIDVEGHEFEVLLGAKKILENSENTTWLIEVGLGEHHPDNQNIKFLDTFNIFLSRGYKVYAVGKSISLINNDDINHLSLMTGRAEQINYLFTKKELPISLLNELNA